MTLRLTAIVLALLSSALFLGAPFGQTQAGEAHRILRIGTSPQNGTYFPIGDVLAREFTRSSEAVACGACPRLLAVAQASSGSVANVEGLRAGALEAALVQADVAYSAYSGKGRFQGLEINPRIRAIAHLFSESLHIVSRRGSGITSVDRLRDRRVGLHQQGSGTLVGARLVLATEGMAESDLRSHYVGTDRAIELLSAGRLDAFFMVSGYPAEPLKSLGRSATVDLVPVESETVQAMAKTHPYLAPSVIPAGTYPGIDDTPTLAVGTQLVVHADLEEELVYRMTQTLWRQDTLEALAKGHAKGGEIRLESALMGLAVPLHPGAARFYREWNLVE